MIEIEGNIWDYTGKYIVIPINLEVKKNGENIMGAGLALEAKNKFPNFPKMVGNSIKAKQFNETRRVNYYNLSDMDNGYNFYYNGVAFPTKYKPQYTSCLNLILWGAKQLAHDFGETNFKCYLPRLGCGVKTGQLDWSTQVKPILANILNDNFIVVTPPKESFKWVTENSLYTPAEKIIFDEYHKEGIKFK